MRCRLSIIIPAYNSEATIARCLDSLKSQLTDDVEVIVVDDGSSDATSEICDGYSSADPRFRIFHKENGGVSSARNVGLDYSNGSWITFLDSDDKLADGALELILNALDYGKDMVVENVVMCEVSGNSFPVLPTVIDSLERMFCEPLSGSVWNKVFRRDIIENFGLRFDISLSFYEDWLFTGGYCAHVKNFTYINEPCYIEFLPRSYAEKYGNLRDFNHMLYFYGKLRPLNEPMSRMWVDRLVMSALSECTGYRDLMKKVLAMKNAIGRDILYAKGARKFGIRLLIHTDSVVVWRIVLGFYYMLRCY